MRVPNAGGLLCLGSRPIRRTVPSVDHPGVADSAKIGLLLDVFAESIEQGEKGNGSDEKRGRVQGEGEGVSQRSWMPSMSRISPPKLAQFWAASWICSLVSSGSA